VYTVSTLGMLAIHVHHEVIINCSTLGSSKDRVFFHQIMFSLFYSPATCQQMDVVYCSYCKRDAE
jgi:hypothetical protein